jgi:hypothetical protein
MFPKLICFSSRCGQAVVCPWPERHNYIPDIVIKASLGLRVWSLYLSRPDFNSPSFNPPLLLLSSVVNKWIGVSHSFSSALVCILGLLDNKSCHSEHLWNTSAQFPDIFAFGTSNTKNICITASTHTPT